MATTIIVDNGLPSNKKLKFDNREELQDYLDRVELESSEKVIIEEMDEEDLPEYILENARKTLKQDPKTFINHRW